MAVIANNLGRLLREHRYLYGVICRDTTLTDIELMAQAGYHVVWIDLEHSSQSIGETVKLCRTITHLGMAPLVRIVELSRGNVQPLVDGGVQIVALPDVRSAAAAAELVRLTKYPPIGERGVSTTNAGIGFHFGPDRQETLRKANDAVYPMVMFESDEGYKKLEEILSIEDVAIVTTGAMDWSTSLGFSEEKAKNYLTPMIDRVIRATTEAGKIAAIGAGSPEQAQYFVDLGVRMIFVGVDVAIKRKALINSLCKFQNTIESSHM